MTPAEVVTYFRDMADEPDTTFLTDAQVELYLDQAYLQFRTLVETQDPWVYAEAVDIAFGGTNTVNLAALGLMDAPERTPVRLATAAALPAYTRTGNVIEQNAAAAGLTIDGTAAVLGDRVLLLNGASAIDNGIYIVTTIGSATTRFRLTRATDFDDSADVYANVWVRVTAGTVNANLAFRVTSAGTVTVNTTPITFGATSPATSVVQNPMKRILFLGEEDESRSTLRILQAVTNPEALATTPDSFMWRGRDLVVSFTEDGTLRLYYIAENNINWTGISGSQSVFIDTLATFHELIPLLALKRYFIRDGAASDNVRELIADLMGSLTLFLLQRSAGQSQYVKRSLTLRYS